MKERLQKIIAAAGLGSRRQAESWIAAGEVTVDGIAAALGDKADPATQTILVRGKKLVGRRGHLYLLLNKPAGVMCTRSDPQGRPLIFDLVPEKIGVLFTVGRLDMTTEGLILLTDDGELAHRLAHPAFKVEKTYLVRARGKLSQEHLDALERGVVLEDGLTAPARLDRVRFGGGHTWLEITLREGRNRQVRRMLEAVGHPVSRLKRIRYAFLEIDGLETGRYRPLTQGEIARLKNLVPERKNDRRLPE
ncbi:MAG: rRNA pseudouridine synthase [Deltaproteobacteria bacterium]|nr:rRNA pseudouridine synthase [Deltaproteobacteria bacterium]